MTENTIKECEGRIGRIAADSVVYVNLEREGLTLSVNRDLIAKGDTPLPQLGFDVGTRVLLSYDTRTGFVTEVTLIESDARGKDNDRGNSSELPQVPSLDDTTDHAQIALNPDDSTPIKRRVRRAFSNATLKFGKLIDTTSLQPGDLLLTREKTPDSISQIIVETQRSGGYREEDALWTHAAMYVGDGSNVVESTFESLFDGGVRLTNLDNYCEGKHFIRVRRSRYLTQANDGWRLCVCAMSKLNRSYNFLDAASMWYKVRFRKKSFNMSAFRRSDSEMLICSTLYADAYNEAMRRTLGEIYGVCVPAWLSVTDEFEDIKASWVDIT